MSLNWDSPEDAFRELDEMEYSLFAKALADYRNQLMKEGFTRRESLRLVESYSKFIYDMVVEEFLAQKRKEEMIESLTDKPDDDDVDTIDDDDIQ